MTQTPRMFLVGLLLALTACGGPGTSSVPTGTAPSMGATLLQGRVVNWSGGTASVHLRDGATVLAQGSLSAVGDFSLTLPTGAGIDASLRTIGTPGLTGGCTSVPEVSDPAARWRTFEGFAVVQNGAVVGGIGRAYGLTSLDSAKPGDYQVRWTYVDRPLDLTGTASCPSFKETYDVQFKAGWNVSVLEHTTAYTPGSYHEVRWHSGSDAAARWGFLPRGQ